MGKWVTGATPEGDGSRGCRAAAASPVCGLDGGGQPSEGSTDKIADRCARLAQVLTTGLQLVVVELKADEDSPEIFETLNAC